MPNNYILLETIALTQSAASVTFDNLPTSGYTDLKIVFSARSSDAAVFDNVNISLNGSTANFSQRTLVGSGSAASSSSSSNNTFFLAIPGSGSTASTFSNSEIYIPNYRSSNNKSFSGETAAETNATTAYIYLVAGLWSNTAAITSITLTSSVSANFVASSTFSLYGVAALGTTPVLAPKATGGNIVANDGTYWYHAFTSSGNFVPQVGLTADVLVVAGGGGGGSLDGGGGGAGGLLVFTSQALANGTNYACSVGAGGTGATTSTATQGINSQFAALTASVGGGLGGGFNGTSVAGGIGGSGGGGGYNNDSGGIGTFGQGNNGGSGLVVPSVKAAGGGGGGSGATGTAATSSAAGNGGNGVITYSSWLSPTTLGVSGYIAAGGGGGGDNRGTTAGTGGLGGGGNGSISATATSGQSNTGSGGGGGGFNGSTQNGGAGGSGIVIIRYPIA